MLRNLKHHINAIIIKTPLELAEKKLEHEKYENKSTIYISSLNGADLFIKENDSVRVSTQKEWEDYHS